MSKMMKTSIVAAAMLAHHAALQSKIHTFGGYEKREAPADLKKLGETIDRIATAFEEYKKTNDARLAEIKAKGSADPLLEGKLAKIDAELTTLGEVKAQLEKLDTRMSRPGALGGGDREQRQSPESLAYKQAFFAWVRNPQDSEIRSRLQQRQKALREVEAKAFGGDDGFETRAAQTVTTTGAAGGFALPEVIERSIARLAVDIGPLRQIATVRTVGSSDYKELFDVGGAAFEWVGETDTRNQTNTPDMAEIAPTFGMASAKPQASEESLDDLFFDVEQWLIESAAEALAAGEGASFVSGNGTKKPTGFLAGPAPLATADASRAFGTLQYIAGGQAAAMPTTLDPLYDMVYGLRARYRSNARWVTSKLLLAALRKYKDSTGQYLWQPSLSASQPEAFMGYPITEAEDMPALAANAFPLAFGDFREGYLIADRVGMRMTRDEITTPGFVKFYVRKRVGGRLRNTQAIKLLKISAS
jgi:HK97 family phage major capsid protein